MLFILILGLIKLCASNTVRRGDLRVYQGHIDSKNQFYFAVAVEGTMLYIRSCTGSLIADNWVLTAAHCVTYINIVYPPEVIVIRYGDYTKRLNETKLYKKVIRIYVHPNYQYSGPGELNDIALLFVERVPIKHVKLLALDYKTLVGLPVTYAGFGKTTKTIQNKIPVQMLPIQVGEGVVTACPSGERGLQYKQALLCVASKCVKRVQQARPGDSGGPLLYDRRVIGVAKIVSHMPPFSDYTPVSVFLDWIKNTMHSNGQ